MRKQVCTVLKYELLLFSSLLLLLLLSYVCSCEWAMWRAYLKCGLTDMDLTPMHLAFEEATKDAKELNIPVTGSEVVGLVPLKALLGLGLDVRLEGLK